MQTLKLYEGQKESLQKERQECKLIKQKLITLQRMDLLLNGKIGLCSRGIN